ncbi:MAG: TRAM domain-containing protein [Candidatus Bathyarchaeota archaeon]|nr:TRAM domain-containing protein [Candidatus Bathyarchaeum tardum]WGM90194.1 MAG: TRAM domain-containing protein [Candidatus Bathyarchaeum tardum]WNZ29717.1 MAG: TRAM domain-containing protein [Candidatus Bathyarchaeota archaeon]
MKRSQKNAKSRNRNTVRCPVQIGDEYNVDITDTTPTGFGIARIQGFLVLINHASLGKNKTIVITKTDSLNAEAELV